MLQLKKSLNHWIDVDGVEILIDYPTLEQQEELDDLYETYMAPCIAEYAKLKSENVEDKEASILSIAKMDKKTYRKHQILTIKYCVKGWKFEDEIKIVDNALSDNCLTPLVRDKKQRDLLYEKIQEEVSWTENDKKK